MTFSRVNNAQIVNIHQQIEKLKYIPNSDVYDSTMIVFNSINGLTSKSDRFKNTKIIAEIVKEKDKRTYCHTLVHLGEYADSNNMDYFEKSLDIAEKMDLTYELGWINSAISQYYIKIQKYDSAMHHILVARDYF
ncbi:MAG: hypothetical protein KF721_14220 [Ignavibacteriaceae bacterium]|nr:hypothetical protein [Ignavibacteriaceae bacterium]